MCAQRSGSRPTSNSHVVGVWELERSEIAPDGWIRITCSMPGRAGAHTKVWPSTNGLVDARLAEDLVSWLISSIRDAVLYGSGIQQTLL